MTIKTKLLKSKFYCYATIDGYDHSFYGDTLDEAQSQMRVLIDKKKIQGKIFGKVEWEPIKSIKEPKLPVPKPPYIRYSSSRIDNNPIA